MPLDQIHLPPLQIWITSNQGPPNQLPVVPLQFWFSRDVGLSLPMIAIPLAPRPGGDDHNVDYDVYNYPMYIDLLFS